ncbi:MAG TPA: hypothetical protein VF214_10245 [Edaphobacter sp.]
MWRVAKQRDKPISLLEQPIKHRPLRSNTPHNTPVASNDKHPGQRIALAAPVILGRPSNAEAIL